MGIPTVKVGSVIAGRYRLVAPLSRGGMGSVWRAEHLALGSPIAIKLIDASLVEHDEPRARFEQEARAAAALRSPHVVQILDHGVDKGLPFMAMELLDGESLASRLHRLGTLPHAQTVRIFQDVARAVRKAHEIGIIHRDLKPDNIFLVKNDDQEIAKILDFGIAKAENPLGEWKGGTRTGALIGTPQYMSPEQAQGIPVDFTTDLWALGVIAFECACGRLPFPSEKPGELILQICVRPLPVPTQVARVPARFDPWFARACNREPKHRFTSAKELADALAEVLGVAADSSGQYAAVHLSGFANAQMLSPVVAPALSAQEPSAPRDVRPASPRVQVVNAPVVQTPGGTELPLPAAPALAPAAARVAVSPVNQGNPGHTVVSGAVASPPLAAPAAPAIEPQAAAHDVRSGGTMSGGAVMDSDPATLLRLSGSRGKRALVGLGAAGVLLVGAALWWVASGPSPSTGATGETSAGASNASSEASSAPSPGITVVPSTAAADSASSAPSTGAPATSGSSLAGGGGSARPSSSARSKPPGSTAPKGSGAPPPVVSGSATSTNPRVGW